MPHQSPPQHIGTLNENPLHAGLKEWCSRPGDEVEVPVDGYLVDIVRGELLIEVQTRSFYAIRDKLRRLASNHPVRLVHPLAADKWLVKLADDGDGVQDRRRSPKHCTALDVFDELVSCPALLAESGFSLHVVLTEEEEVRRHEEGRAWRRKGWIIVERRLLDVVDDVLLETPADFRGLLPDDLPEPFTTADLANRASIRRRLAQKMAYSMREMGAITQTGKRGNAYLYTRQSA